MREFAKLRTVFLLDFGWSFMVKLTQYLIDGQADPSIPLGFCDHLGIDPNTSRTYRGPDGHGPITVVFNRNRNRSETFISGLDSSVRAVQATPGDLGFVAFQRDKYKLYLRTWQELQGSEALGQLLWWCGLDPRDDEVLRNPWRRLTRALGGEGGSREAVRQLLLSRRDTARLELLDQARSGGMAPAEWPGSWRYTAVPRLIGYKYFGVTNGQALRVAIGVGGLKRSAPVNRLIQSRDGVIWWDCTNDVTDDATDQSVEEMAKQSVDTDFRVDSEWAKWAYAEQRARRIALSIDRSFAWRIPTDTLSGEGSAATAVLTALEGLPAPEEAMEIASPKVVGPYRYARNAAGFRLALKRAVRNGLTSIKSDPTLGFVAEYAGRPSQRGVNLVEVLT